MKFYVATDEVRENLLKLHERRIATMTAWEAFRKEHSGLTPIKTGTSLAGLTFDGKPPGTMA